MTMQPEPERRIGYGELLVTIERIDKRTERIEERLFFGNGEALTTQVARHDDQIKDIRRISEQAGGRAGAQWGAVVGTAIAAVAASFWAMISGKPPGQQ